MNNVLTCPNCGNGMRDFEHGWICENCKGVLDNEGKFHEQEMKGIIICGFPGIGKSVAARKSRDVEDMESSGFKWIYDPHQLTRVSNPAFPSNYVDAIEEVGKTYTQFIAVACHREVRNELKGRGLGYVIVAPEKNLKDEYMARYLSRGNNIEFIENLYEKWDLWLDELEIDGAPIIHLKSGENLYEMLYGK